MIRPLDVAFYIMFTKNKIIFSAYTTQITCAETVSTREWIPFSKRRQRSSISFNRTRLKQVLEVPENLARMTKIEKV